MGSWNELYFGSRIALFKAVFITCNNSSRHIVFMSGDKQFPIRPCQSVQQYMEASHIGGGGGGGEGNAILGHTFLGPFLDFQGVHGLK